MDGCVFYLKKVNNKDSTTGSVNITSEDQFKIEEYIGKIDFVMLHL